MTIETFIMNNYDKLQQSYCDSNDVGEPRCIRIADGEDSSYNDREQQYSMDTMVELYTDRIFNQK